MIEEEGEEHGEEELISQRLSQHYYYLDSEPSENQQGTL